MPGLFPEQSFQHTLREIAVNREDPCELVRELVSNAYDAKATEIILTPYLEKRGILFFDNGIGLSQTEHINGVLPYVAFFSIGKGTKHKGASIGYKCQGSKLCFASEVVTIVTRCKGEPDWRWKQLQNPKRVLSEHFDISPESTTEPWKVLAEKVFSGGDQRTQSLKGYFDETFFRAQFSTGTLIIVEEFEVEDYEKYFGRISTDSYLHNYIKLYTAHGDVRLLSNSQGFDATEVALFSGYTRRSARFTLYAGDEAVAVAPGWPYLDKGNETALSPIDVDRLRDSRFCARYAGNFDHEGVRYSMVLALDGQRRAMSEYNYLGRKGSAKSGITLSSQRGTFLCVQGVRVCSYNELWEASELTAFSEFSEDQNHYVFMLDGDFDLVTNRNAPSPESKAKLRDAGLLRKIQAFLELEIPGRRNGTYLRELAQRLGNDRTHQREALYAKAQRELVKDLGRRASFTVSDIEHLNDRYILEPSLGEEHFVGALYTMFSHLVAKQHPLAEYWARPLTYSARGIDALAVSAGDAISDASPVEYKHTFRSIDEFNHPLSQTRSIVCWKIGDIRVGDIVEDSYDYRAVVACQLEVGSPGTELEFAL